MSSTRKTVCVALVVGALVVGGMASTAEAVDGVTLINQLFALAGFVTPGDAPGYPVTITRPGSYRLSGNLQVPDENTTAIVIQADDVTLDLNGFGIFGPTVCSIVEFFGLVCSPTGSGDGVQGGCGADNVTVMNGTVRGMGREGIFLCNARIERVSAVSNGGDGIFVSSGQVVRSTARSNGANGIQCSISPPGCTVVGNTALGNKFVGLFINHGGYVHNVFADNNGGNANPQIGVGSGAEQMGGNVCGGALC